MHTDFIYQMTYREYDAIFCKAACIIPIYIYIYIRCDILFVKTHVVKWMTVTLVNIGAFVTSPIITKWLQCKSIRVTCHRQLSSIIDWAYTIKLGQTVLYLMYPPIRQKKAIRIISLVIHTISTICLLYVFVQHKSGTNALRGSVTLRWCLVLIFDSIFPFAG